MTTLRDQLKPFLELRLADWRGLPDASLANFEAALGKARNMSETGLGHYPTMRSTFPLETPSGGLYAYSRESQVVMIEALRQPPIEVIAELGEPMGVLPHETLLKGAYTPVYVYGEHGLVLTVAIPFGSNRPREIVRCRGMRPIADIREFGPELYQAFEDRTVY